MGGELGLDGDRFGRSHLGASRLGKGRSRAQVHQCSQRVTVGDHKNATTCLQLRFQNLSPVWFHPDRKIVQAFSGDSRCLGDLRVPRICLLRYQLTVTG